MRSAIRVVCITITLILGVGTSLAVRGTVVDEQGQGVKAANVCFVSGSTAHRCVQTNERGRFYLPATPGYKVKISAVGYLPKTIPPLDPVGPIVLERDASVFVKLVDASTGEAIPKGTVYISLASGRRLGPFPPSAGGVKIASLEPGRISVVGGAEGYADSSPRSVVLKAGKVAEAILELDPEAKGSGP